jgi:glycyl-tRNA synthetase (class II)
VDAGGVEPWSQAGESGPGVGEQVPGDDEDGAAHRDDDASAIVRRYRQQDEIGTPFCVTRELRLAQPSGGDGLRSMQQVRIGIGALQGCLAERLAGC